MQRLPAEALDDQPELVGQPVRLGGVAGRVDGIGNQRMADMRHMHADLVGAPGFELAGEPGDVPALTAVPGHNGIVRNRLAPVTADSLLEAVVRVAAERCLDSAPPLLHAAPGEGDVLAVERPRT